MVLRVKPTPTRFLTNSLYTPVGNTPMHSIPSVTPVRQPLLLLEQEFVTKASLLSSYPGVNISQVSAKSLVDAHISQRRLEPPSPNANKVAPKQHVSPNRSKKTVCSILYSQLREQGKFRPHGGAPPVIGHLAVWGCCSLKTF